MVVDDDPSNLHIFEAMLADAGFAVRLFPSGRLALQAAGANPPEIVILDIRMPEMDGYDVCRRLKKLPALRDTPVIFVSALHDTDDIVQGFTAGGSDYIVKPIRSEELLARVRLHLSLRRSRLDLEARNRELDQQYRRLRELERLRDDLVHMLVHDLRAPLSGVSLVLESLSRTATQRPPGEIMDHLQAVAAAVHGVLQNLRVILDVSRLEEGKLPLHRSLLSATALIQESLLSLGGLTQGREIRVEAGATPMPVFGDRALCVRLIANLVDNALKHTPAGRPITIRAAAGPAATRISVQDQGPGIPPEDRERMFDKFATGPIRKRTAAGSSGLGLAFCRLVTLAHGGSIGVESETGSGSTFWVLLPNTKEGQQP
jgi:signal transduction histidine kinase